MKKWLLTDEELIRELEKRLAIIVHCSRPGKSDDAGAGLLFPDDLHTAIQICGVESKELCCSVIWPDHVKTFGAIGIILRPRSTSSVTSICTTDGGTSLDSVSGVRVGLGDPFSTQGVADTFNNATDYNEWNVRDADTIGLFIHPTEPLQVARKVRRSEIPGYDPSMGEGDEVGTCGISATDIRNAFPGMPIYSYQNGRMVRFQNDGQVLVEISDLYK